jgi:hypothetical protein
MIRNKQIEKYTSNIFKTAREETTVRSTKDFGGKITLVKDLDQEIRVQCIHISRISMVLPRKEGSFLHSIQINKLYLTFGSGNTAQLIQTSIPWKLSNSKTFVTNIQ